MTGTPACLARVRRAAAARGAGRARVSNFSPPRNSMSLIQSMSNRTTGHWSGALPFRLFCFGNSASVGGDRGIERRRQRRLAADQSGPGEFEPVALAFQHELQPVRGNRQHVRLLADLHFALEWFFEFSCHLLASLSRIRTRTVCPI